MTGRPSYVVYAECALGLELKRLFHEDDVPGPLAAVRSQSAIVLGENVVAALGEEPHETALFVGDAPSTDVPLHEDDRDVDQVKELGGAGLGEHARLVLLDVHLHAHHQRCRRPASSAAN